MLQAAAQQVHPFVFTTARTKRASTQIPTHVQASLSKMAYLYTADAASTKAKGKRRDLGQAAHPHFHSKMVGLESSFAEKLSAAEYEVFQAGSCICKACP